MFELFTDRARRVMVLAHDAAIDLGHDHIAPEHILLGLAAEGEGVAYVALDAVGARADGIRDRLGRSAPPDWQRADPADALASVGIDLERVRRQVETTFGQGSLRLPRTLPLGPAARGTLEAATREAGGLGHNYVGTEHLLLAVNGVDEGLTPRILAGLGAERPALRRATLGIVRWATELGREPVYAAVSSLERAVAVIPEAHRDGPQRVMSEVVLPARAAAIVGISSLPESASPEAIGPAMERMGEALAEATALLGAMGVGPFLELARGPVASTARLAVDRALMTIGALVRAAAADGIDRFEQAVALARAARALRDSLWSQLWDDGSDVDNAVLTLRFLGTIAELGRLAWSLAAPLAGSLADDELMQLGAGRR